ncbi:YraN family protein [Brevibacillus sp. GCM10020057]|uniref:YraN family protein n=1 Tax=Brevibacillus sp. GCM10020057 TaxID=3317327 RepID=UPI00364044CC
MSERRRALGQQGEQLAETYLIQKGYEIVGRNVRTRRGEIDLIAVDRGSLVFVEVRTRSSLAFGTAAESVSWRKRQKLRELAMEYLQGLSRYVPAFRFDVIAIHVSRSHESGRHASIEHIEHAF